jgi:tetratricopeptide (TPR) repeat protein
VEEAPVGPAVAPGPARWPLAVALLNVTGLSLGHWYLGRRRRAVLHLLVTAGLLAAAFLTDAASRPWQWRAIFAVWIAWQALDGWWLAHWHPHARTAPRRRPTLVATATILLIAAGYVLYDMAGHRTNTSGEAAQAAGDCTTATTRYNLVTGPFELTLSGDVAAAEQNREYCSQFLVAVARQDRREFESAIAGYREFLDRTPANLLDAPAHDRIQLAHLEWGRSARAGGDYPAAIKIYQDLVKDYGKAWSAKQARSELAQTYLDQAQLFRSRFDPNGGDTTVDDVRKAMQNYSLIQKDFGDTEAAAAVPKAIVDTFNAAIQPFTNGKYCEALPTLEYLVGMPADRTAGVVPTAQEHQAKAAYECGVLRYQAGAFDEAVTHFETTLTYPNHPLAAAAGSAYIAATIAVRKPGTVPPLAPPLGGNTPGSISLKFFNDTSVPMEVLLTGPTAHRFVLPACPSCPESYDNDADACATSAGKPTFELRLQPGTYYFLNRDVDTPDTEGEVATVALRSAEIYCLYRSPNPP